MARTKGKRSERKAKPTGKRSPALPGSPRDSPPDSPHNSYHSPGPRPARRRSSVPAKAPDWRAVERAAAVWNGLRLMEADVERVVASLTTPRGRRIHAELVS